MQIIIKKSVNLTLEGGKEKTYAPSDDVITISEEYAKEHNLYERYTAPIVQDRIIIVDAVEAIKEDKPKQTKSKKKNVEGNKEA